MVLGVVCSSHISYYPHQLYDFIEKKNIALAGLCMSHVVKIKFIWCSIVATVSLREENCPIYGAFFSSRWMGNNCYDSVNYIWLCWRETSKAGPAHTFGLELKLDSGLGLFVEPSSLRGCLLKTKPFWRKLIHLWCRQVA